VQFAGNFLQISQFRLCKPTQLPSQTSARRGILAKWLRNGNDSPPASRHSKPEIVIFHRDNSWSISKPENSSRLSDGLTSKMSQHSYATTAGQRHNWRRIAVSIVPTDITVITPIELSSVNGAGARFWRGSHASSASKNAIHLPLGDPCTVISSCRRPSVSLADEFDREAARYRSRFILRSVVDDDDFRGRHSLSERAFNGREMVGRSVVYGITTLTVGLLIATQSRPAGTSPGFDPVQRARKNAPRHKVSACRASFHAHKGLPSSEKASASLPERERSTKCQQGQPPFS